MRTRSFPSRSVGLLVLVLTVLSLGCERTPLPSAFVLGEALPTPPEAFNLTVAVTRGNHTYVPVNVDVDALKFHVRLLELVEAFEQAHPELEVSCFDVEASQPGGMPRHLYDLWLHHRPKPKS